MTFVSTGKSLLAAAAFAVALAPLAAVPASAQDRGVSITIQKAPSYLNTRTTPNPGSATRAYYDTSAIYQPFQSQRNSVGFSRAPLPSSFDIPGY